jgi:hypothetical protein
MYDAALSVQILLFYNFSLFQDFEKLEQELLRVGTHYSSSKRFEKSRKTGPSIEYLLFLEELYEQELLFQRKKQKILDCYLEIYEHIIDPLEQKRITQIIINLIGIFPPRCFFYN